MRVRLTIVIAFCQQVKRQKVQQGLLLSAAAAQFHATRSVVSKQIKAYVCDPMYNSTSSHEAWRVQLHTVIQQQNTRPLVSSFAMHINMPCLGRSMGALSRAS